MLTVRTVPAHHTTARSVARRSAARPIATFDRTFDQAFDQLVGSFFDGRRSPAGPVLDATWQGDVYVLTVDLPGVPASAVTVEVAGTTLSVRATTTELDWQRSLRLGGRLDPAKVEASHVDGRLTVRIGAVDAPVARRVELSTAPVETLGAPETAAIDAVSSADESTATDAADQPSDTNDAG